MDFVNEKVEKICSFYVSDWHLVTMLLPYINKKVEEKSKITTILEKDIESNIETLVQKLNLKKSEKILEINWKKQEVKKYSKLAQILSKQIDNNVTENIILVNGTKEYIDKVNKNLNKYISNLKENKTKIKIINFYEVLEFNYNITEILDEHDKILNTSGEKEIYEVFEGYEKGKSNIAK